MGSFVFTKPTEAFFIQLKVACGVGGGMALPFWIFQLWRFVGKALKMRERTLFLGILPSALGLFFLGAAVALFVVVPAAMKFLLGYSSPTLQPMISLGEYVAFVFWMTLGFGLFFQIPLVIVALARLGFVDPILLVQYRKHVVLGIFVAAAALTPGPDIVSQLALAVPSYVLFELALILAKRVYKSPLG
ncbi:MAG: Sec-independent protein translocase protein TatC [Elusimicrobia bacterium]|nr:Sec-independent protein translocase protein TatC [Elusimicrobiota bacterium]